MHDKVLGIIRETLLHENTVEDIAVRLSDGQVVITFSQPNEESSWPDHELRLTFDGVREFIASATGHETRWTTLLGIECGRDANDYQAEISIGEAGATEWVLRLRFGDLRFKRT
jgi:hypothetical protein